MASAAELNNNNNNSISTSSTHTRSYFNSDWHPYL